MADETSGVRFVGRLATYKYYNAGSGRGCDLRSTPKWPARIERPKRRPLVTANLKK
ncbi:MAG: hypothetical protein WKF84_08120 [Pyrinomonadaceae bacterium]